MKKRDSKRFVSRNRLRSQSARLLGVKRDVKRKKNVQRRLKKKGCSKRNLRH